MSWLKGKKTYIISGLLLLVGVFKVVVGDMGVMELLQSQALFDILGALGLASLRSGVASIK